MYGHDGAKLKEENPWSSSTAEISYKLLSSGTYTILAYDGNSVTLTGNYNVHLQRTNNPGSATSINFGQTLSGSIEVAAEMDSYTFSANANDNIILRVSRTSGDMWAGVRLYGPDGAKLKEENPWSSSTAEISYKLLSSGTYTILAYDGNSVTRTGGYNVYLGGVVIATPTPSSSSTPTPTITPTPTPTPTPTTPTPTPSPTPTVTTPAPTTPTPTTLVPTTPTPTTPTPTITRTLTPTSTPTLTTTTPAKTTLPATRTPSPTATSLPAVVSVNEKVATIAFPSVAAGQYTSVQIPSEKEQAVSKIALSVKNSVSNAALNIETMQSKPADVKTEAPGKVYRYLSISPQNIQSSYLYSAEIGFKIEKSWIAGNQIDPDGVTLYRYRDGQWNVLSTDKLNEDSDYIYYVAATSGFSIFAIAAPLSSETITNWVPMGIVGLILLGIIILFILRRKKPQIEIRRTVYDPVTKDFVSEKKLHYPEVLKWLSAHPPPDYWYILRIDNHGSTVEQWAVELETQKAVSVKEAYIDGNNFTSLLQKEESSMQKDTYWKNRYIFTVPKEKGQTLPSNGVRRLYFRLNIDCNVVLQSRYTISGRLITKGITPIPEKDFPFSCDIKEIKKIHAKEAQTVEKYITDRAQEYEPIKKSRDKDDMRRAAYYCCELFLLHLNLQKAPDALKYCLDMLNYASGETREEVEKLVRNLEFKVKNHSDISEDFLEKAEVVTHKVRMGWE